MKVVYLISDYTLHNHIVSTHVKQRPQDEVSIVKVPLVVKGKGRMGSFKKVWGKLSSIFVLAKFIEFIALTFLSFIPKFINKGFAPQRLRWLAYKHDLPYHFSDNVMRKETLDFIRSQEPDVIVTLFHQIVKKELIDIPKKHVINIHPGLLPDFKGIQPYFWELCHNATHAGAPLHLIEDETIDTGKILAQGKYKLWPEMSVQVNYYLTSTVAADLLPQCLDLVEKDEFEPGDQKIGEGHYYRWPDHKSVENLFDRGHCLLSLKEFWKMLCGKYDDFRAQRVFHLRKRPSIRLTR